MSTVICMECRLLILSGVLLCMACSFGDHGQYATYAPGVQLAPGSHVVLEEVRTGTAESDGFNPDAKLRAALESELEKSGLKGQPNSAGEIVMLPRIDAFRPGNTFLRWLTSPFVEAYNAELLVRCKLKRDGGEIGTINVRRTVELGGLYAVGQWKYLFDNEATDIVQELKKKIASGR